jgi:hypothetical protein
MFEVRQDLTPEDFIRKEIDHLFILNQALTGTSVQKAESEGEITDIEELAKLTNSFDPGSHEKTITNICSRVLELME